MGEGTLLSLLLRGKGEDPADAATTTRGNGRGSHCNSVAFTVMGVYWESVAVTIVGGLMLSLLMEVSGCYNYWGLWLSLFWDTLGSCVRCFTLSMW